MNSMVLFILDSVRNSKSFMSILIYSNIESSVYTKCNKWEDDKISQKEYHKL